MTDAQQVVFEKPKHPGGRPTDYKPEYCEDIIGHMAKGFSLESYAGKIGTHRDTLYEWMKVHQEFSDSVRVGIEKSLLFFETMGIQGAAGKLPGFNSSVYALTMANKHKWFSARNDVTTDGQKIEAPILFIPAEEEK